MIPAVVLTRQDHANVMSVDSVGSGSEAESLSSPAEMDIIDQSDSSSRLDVSSAACVSSEGDTTSSMDMPIVMASVPSQGQTTTKAKCSISFNAVFQSIKFIIPIIMKGTLTATL